MALTTTEARRGRRDTPPATTNKPRCIRQRARIMHMQMSQRKRTASMATELAASDLLICLKLLTQCPRNFHSTTPRLDPAQFRYLDQASCRTKIAGTSIAVAARRVLRIANGITPVPQTGGTVSRSFIKRSRAPISLAHSRFIR